MTRVRAYLRGAPLIGAPAARCTAAPRAGVHAPRCEDERRAQLYGDKESADAPMLLRPQVAYL
jgi:hypothetical protein